MLSAEYSFCTIRITQPATNGDMLIESTALVNSGGGVVVVVLPGFMTRPLEMPQTRTCESMCLLVLLAVTLDLFGLSLSTVLRQAAKTVSQSRSYFLSLLI